VTPYPHPLLDCPACDHGTVTITTGDGSFGTLEPESCGSCDGTGWRDESVEAAIERLYPEVWPWAPGVGGVRWYNPREPAGGYDHLGPVYPRRRPVSCRKCENPHNWEGCVGADCCRHCALIDSPPLLEDLSAVLYYGVRRYEAATSILRELDPEGMIVFLAGDLRHRLAYGRNPRAMAYLERRRAERGGGPDPYKALADLRIITLDRRVIGPEKASVLNPPRCTVIGFLPPERESRWDSPLTPSSLPVGLP